MNDNDDEQIRDKYAKLVQAFAASLPDRLQRIRQHWQSLQADWQQPGMHAELQREVHSLAGAGATFGYDMISSHARELEELLAGLERDQAPSVERTQQVVQMLDRLAHAAANQQS
jgi:chemotaxis protein histidine kinase CheA